MTDERSGQLDALIDRVQRDHPETWGFGRREVRGDPCGDPPLRAAGRLRALLTMRAGHE